MTGAEAIHAPQHYLDGQRTEPQGTERISVLNPATGQELVAMVESSADDVTRAVESAKKAFSDWSARSGKERGQILLRAAEIMREHLEEISHLETLDNGKPLWESRMDTEGCADSVQFYGGVAGTVMGKHLALPGNSFSYTRREPLGVVGAIGAFNYPLQMACWKSAPALACGNTVVFKPSPLTPLTAVVLADIYTEAGLPPGCFNVIQGGTFPGQALCCHQDVAKVTFTGSVPTGARIMQTCAQDIRKVTLELGGKSPLILFEDCDLENAVKGTMMANYLTQGQVCSNGTRVYVHEEIARQFTDKLVEKTAALRVGDPLNEQTHIGAMISEPQARKVLTYIRKAKEEGGKILVGGERVTPSPELAGGWYISPCVVSDVTDNMTVAREEIFGPVISLMTFRDEADVVRRANDSEFGLAAGVFTKNITRAHRVAASLDTGNVYINNYNIYPVEMPFGGNKKSGLGREGGLEALDYFTQVKHVYVEGGDVWCPY